MDWRTRLLQAGGGEAMGELRSDAGEWQSDTGEWRSDTGEWRSLAMGVHRGSTVVFRDGASVREGPRPERDGWTYGLHGTPTTAELARQVCALEGGRETMLVPSGQAGIALVNLALLGAGDHVLLPRNAYGPSQRLAREVLARFGVEVELYEPTLVEDVRARLRAGRTKLVWCESPGSITMEVADVPAIAEAAHAAGALVAMDNTWAAGVLFDAFGHGVDVSVQALTKYAGGHSDLLMGSVTARDEGLVERLAATRGVMGIGVSPDDCSLVLRGLKTMGVRLEVAGRSGLRVAEWLSGRAEVERVLYPGLAGSPGHELWCRDFSGACGLLAFVLREGVRLEQVRAVVDGLRLFRQGYSWGGVESLALGYDLREADVVEGGVDVRRYGWRLVRLQIGLEAVEDLLEDLRQGLARLESA